MNVVKSCAKGLFGDVGTTEALKMCQRVSFINK